MSDRGHLSNDAAAAFACRMAKTGTRQFVLVHLSKENNTPVCALHTVECALRGGGDGEEEVSENGNALTLKVILVQAVATSIDAFAVGVSLRAQAVSVVVAAPIIALTTFLCCVVALSLGRKLGEVLGDRAQVAGGIVLVLIGLKAFLA